jgi:signal transduction histidine kinase/CheY-like chemotaxis protein
MGGRLLKLLMSWRHAAAAGVALGIGVVLPAPAQTPARLDPKQPLVVIDRAERHGPGERVDADVPLPDWVEAAPGDKSVERRWRVGLDVGDSRAAYALYLSGVWGHVRIAVNGQVLLDTITEPPAPPPRSIGRLHLVDLPPYLLRPRENLVDITVRGTSVASLSRITVGPHHTLTTLRDRKALQMAYAPALVAALIGCLGLSVLLIWVRRRVESIYAIFGIASIAWGLHTAWTVSPRLFLPPLHFGVWWTTLYAFVVAMIAIFALRFAGYSLRRAERALLWSTLAVPVVLYLGHAVGLIDLASNAVRGGMVLVAVVGLAAVSVSAWRRRSVDSMLLVLAGVAAAGLGARDWFVFLTTLDDNLPVQWAPFAGLPFVALVTWFLIDRFVRTNESLESLNRELELRVERKSAELMSALDHMRAARDWADAANRSKTSFLAAASHDLRQPIHALGLYMGALRQRPLESAAREIVDRMDGSVAALDSLFNALLDISRIDAGAVVPAPHAFDIAALLRRLADEFAPQAAERGLRLAARVPAAEPAVNARSDPLLVERVLRNLIANAVKYTDAGGVLLSCRRRGEHWRVEVWDTGCGIADDERERVFEEFYQAGNPERDRRAGLGLGLAIVQRVARLLSLRLVLHSRPGRGTRFVLDLPATDEPVTVPAVAIDLQPLAGMVVAVVEDDMEVRDAMRALVRGWGCLVVDGADAKEVQRECARQGVVPQALVADLRLRGERDGVTEVARLRAAFGAALPALLVSGDSAPERVRLMQQSGLPWLAKPVPAARLRSWLAQMRTTSPGYVARSSS